MPRLNGPDATRQLRESGVDVFIVGITGNMLPEDVATFKNSGADAVLPKPFKLNELVCLWAEHGLINTTMIASKDQNNFEAGCHHA